MGNEKAVVWRSQDRIVAERVQARVDALLRTRPPAKQTFDESQERAIERAPPQGRMPDVAERSRRALAAALAAIAPRPRQRGVQRALEFLRTFLDPGDLVATVTVRDAAAARGISWASVRRAALPARFNRIRVGGRHGAWYWMDVAQASQRT